MFNLINLIIPIKDFFSFFSIHFKSAIKKVRDHLWCDFLKLTHTTICILKVSNFGLKDGHPSFISIMTRLLQKKEVAEIR